MTRSINRPARVIIIGGSMGGLFAGLRFGQAGWDVQIYERAPDELDARGAGIVTHEELFDAMRLVGVEPGVDVGITTRGRSVYAQDGNQICQHPFAQVMTSWSRLYSKLRVAFPADQYHTGMQFVECREKGDTVEVAFSDGTVAEGDLLIAADGIHSTIRAQLAPDCQPAYCGYVAWRALIPEHELPAPFIRDTFMDLAFCLPPGEQFLGYPVAGPNNDLRDGYRNYNVVWYRPADADAGLPWLLTDTDGINNGVSIAPNRIRNEVIADMFADGEQLLPPQFSQVLLKSIAPFIQPIFDLTVSQMAHNRVAVLGDAAFVARPHVGMGVTKAAEDAIALADCCVRHASLHNALKAYDRKRRPEGNFIVEHARDLGCYLELNRSRTAAEQQFADRQREPTAVMVNTANTEFLRTYRETIPS